MKSLRKFCIAAVSLHVSFNLYAGSGVAVVTNTPIKLIGTTAKQAPTTAFASNTAYSQGAYVVSEGKTYMALVGGTSGPVVTAFNRTFDGQDGANSQVTWRPCLQGKRQGLTIVNGGTNGNVFIMDRSTTTNIGVMLAPSGGSVSFAGPSCPQTEFYCLLGTNGLTVPVYTYEW